MQKSMESSQQSWLAKPLSRGNSRRALQNPNPVPLLMPGPALPSGILSNHPKSYGWASRPPSHHRCSPAEWSAPSWLPLLWAPGPSSTTKWAIWARTIIFWTSDIQGNPSWFFQYLHNQYCDILNIVLSTNSIFKKSIYFEKKPRILPVNWTSTALQEKSALSDGMSLIAIFLLKSEIFKS